MKCAAKKNTPVTVAVTGGSLVGEGGFEPPKQLATDLQSAPFGHSGIPPKNYLVGAGGGNRTPNLRITSALLYP